VAHAAEYSNPIDAYAAPVSLEEAARLMARGDATILAGGTDLMVQIADGRRSYGSTLVNIRRIDALRGVAVEGDKVRVGALTTVTDLLHNPVIGELAPVVAQAADKFASDQLRNMATIGGNIVNASPAGDMIIPLLVLDARVVLARWRDGAVTEREVALTDFFTGPGRTVQEETEILSEIRFARPAAGFAARMIKSGPRPALEISTVSAALGAVRDEGGWHTIRLALGAVAPTPFRATRTEAFLEGNNVTPQLARQAAEMAAGEVTPIDDVRASAWYRDHLVKTYVRRLLDDDDLG
jgi:CO/xanthine dehydrogenase FAD-binding subunit